MENRETTDGHRDRQPLWQQRERRERKSRRKRGGETRRALSFLRQSGRPSNQRWSVEGGLTAGGVTARAVELAELSCRDAAAAQSLSSPRKPTPRHATTKLQSLVPSVVL